jgi:alpha-1,2-mannosyltransferase
MPVLNEAETGAQSGVVALRGRTRTWTPLDYGLRVLVVIGALAYVIVAVVIYQVDFGVYRAGGSHAFDGTLYLFDIAGAKFTYPPFSALVFSIWAHAPLALAKGLWALGSYVALWFLVRLVVKRYASPGFANYKYAQFVVFVFAAASNPVRDGLALGQIDVFLALLVVADLCGALPFLPRGLLIGIAASIKLTPLFLIAYLLVVRRIRPALVALATFASLTALTFLVLPKESTTYWLDRYFINMNHFGVDGISNQSINGMLARYFGPLSTHMVWYVPLAMIVGALVLWTAHEVNASRPWLGEAIVVASIVALSPVSWTHHWIYVLPLVVAGFRLGAEPRYRAVLVMTVLLAVSLMIGPYWFVATRFHDSAFAFIVASSDILLLLALFATIPLSLAAQQIQERVRQYS